MDYIVYPFSDYAVKETSVLLPIIYHDYTMLFFRIIAEFTNIQERAVTAPEDSEELMTMLQFIEQARSAGMVKLNDRIRNAMERLTYLLDTYLFEQGPKYII